MISLTTNYRSGQTVLDAAHAVIETDDEALKQLRVPLTAAGQNKATVSVVDFPHTAVEQDWLVNAVKDSLADGVAPSEIAVIVRTNREVEQVTTRLRKRVNSCSVS